MKNLNVGVFTITFLIAGCKAQVGNELVDSLSTGQNDRGIELGTSGREETSLADNTDDYNELMQGDEELTSDDSAGDTEVEEDNDRAVTSSEEARQAKLKEIDKKFLEKFKALSKEEKKELVKKIMKILQGIKDLSQEERRAKLKELRPPLPSKKVLDRILPKKGQGPQAQQQ